MKARWTLARKISLLAMAVSLLVATVASGFIAFAQYRSSFEQMDRELSVLLKATAFNIASSIMFADQKAAENVLMALSFDPKVIAARLVTKNNKILATYSRGTEFAAKNLKTLTTDVQWLEESVGSLQLDIDTSSLRDRLQRQILLMLGAALVALVAIGILVQWLTGMLTLPLRSLGHIADLIGAKNDYSVRAPLASGGDEVAQLTGSFNTMLDRIQSQDIELRAQQETLALQIAERTTSLREKTALLLEVHHRVKNNLQVISSLLRLETSRSEHKATKAVLKDMQGRVRAMALLHETIYRKGTFAAIDLGGYIGQIASEALKSLLVSAGTVQLRLDMGSVQAGIDQATPCGMLVTELVSNCLKHGFTEGRTGEISVALSPLSEPGVWRLRISDNGIGLPADFESKRKNSLGLLLVEDLAGQMGGKFHIGAGPKAVFTVDFTVVAPAPLVITLGGLAP
jgi:two-component sensor histidine kinase